MATELPSHEAVENGLPAAVTGSIAQEYDPPGDFVDAAASASAESVPPTQALLPTPQPSYDNPELSDGTASGMTKESAELKEMCADPNVASPSELSNETGIALAGNDSVLTAPSPPPPAASAAAAAPAAPDLQQKESTPAAGDKPRKEEQVGSTIVEESPQGRFQRFDEVLGKGGFKTVYKAYDSLEGCEVAWNQVKLSGVPDDEKKRIVNEVQLLYSLKHENILEFRGTWVKSKDEIIFITEILAAGSLKSFIKKVKVIRWKVVKRWCKDILKGLAYLHSCDPPVIHRDLKCDNIFINGQKGDLRIGDLGLSRRKDVADKGLKNLTLAGTPAFMAPEFYTEQYDEKVDIYALGMCTLEMLTKEYPYAECGSAMQIMKAVMEGQTPKSLEQVKFESANEFIKLCLQADPKLRPSAAELCEHAFLQTSYEDDIEVKLGEKPPSPMETTASRHHAAPLHSSLGTVVEHPDSTGTAQADTPVIASNPAPQPSVGFAAAPVTTNEAYRGEDDGTLQQLHSEPPAAQRPIPVRPEQSDVIEPAPSVVAVPASFLSGPLEQLHGGQSLTPAPFSSMPQQTVGTGNSSQWDSHVQAHPQFQQPFPAQFQPLQAPAPPQTHAQAPAPALNFTGPVYNPSAPASHASQPAYHQAPPFHGTTQQMSSEPTVPPPPMPLSNAFPISDSAGTAFYAQGGFQAGSVSHGQSGQLQYFPNNSLPPAAVTQFPQGPAPPLYPPPAGHELAALSSNGLAWRPPDHFEHERLQPSLHHADNSENVLPLTAGYAPQYQSQFTPLHHVGVLDGPRSRANTEEESQRNSRVPTAEAKDLVDKDTVSFDGRSFDSQFGSFPAQFGTERYNTPSVRDVNVLSESSIGSMGSIGSLSSAGWSQPVDIEPVHRTQSVRHSVTASEISDAKASKQIFDVNIDVAFEGDVFHRVSFPFDVISEDAATVARSCCEALKISEEPNGPIFVEIRAILDEIKQSKMPNAGEQFGNDETDKVGANQNREDEGGEDDRLSRIELSEAQTAELKAHLKAKTKSYLKRVKEMEEALREYEKKVQELTPKLQHERKMLEDKNAQLEQEWRKEKFLRCSDTMQVAHEQSESMAAPPEPQPLASAQLPQVAPPPPPEPEFVKGGDSFDGGAATSLPERPIAPLPVAAVVDLPTVNVLVAIDFMDLSLFSTALPVPSAPAIPGAGSSAVRPAVAEDAPSEELLVSGRNPFDTPFAPLPTADVITGARRDTNPDPFQEFAFPSSTTAPDPFEEFATFPPSAPAAPPAPTAPLAPPPPPPSGSMGSAPGSPPKPGLGLASRREEPPGLIAEGVGGVPLVLGAAASTPGVWPLV